MQIKWRHISQLLHNIILETLVLASKHIYFEVNNCNVHIFNFVPLAVILTSEMAAIAPLSSYIYIIKEKLETLTSMESYLPTSDRHAASWIFSDGPSKQLGVVKLRYNALKLFFIMSLFYAKVPVSASDSHSRQFLWLTQAQL